MLMQKDQLNNQVFQCETYNCKKGTNYGSATLFSDADNNWTAGEFANTAKDNAGLDAHWRADKVWDYWQTIHGKNSYNEMVLP